MTMFQMRKPLLLLIFAFTLAGGSIMSIERAVAHMSAYGVIKERMMLMKELMMMNLKYTQKRN